MLDLAGLEDVFAYDPSTGEFTWKIRPSARVRQGDKAGCVGTDGYLKLRYGRRTYEGQRVAWYLVHGELPEMVDHKDGNPTNNALHNLRAVSRYENAYNSKLSVNNTSGVKGVTWDKSCGKWLARVSVAGRRYKVGHYSDLEYAKQAVKQFRAERHGEYANNGF